MGYRTLRKFKQEQREYEYRQEREQDAYFEYEPPLTDDEREQTASDEHYERLDAAAQYGLPMRRVRIWDEVEVGR
jgi:hypothetical protein